MAVQGDDIVIFNYMIQNDELKIDRVDLNNKKWKKITRLNFNSYFFSKYFQNGIKKIQGKK